MKKILLVLYVLVLILITGSCSSNLNEYERDEFDNIPFNTTGEDIHSNYKIIDDFKTEIKVFSDDYIANSDSNTYILYFNDANPYYRVPSGSLVYLSNDENFSSFITTNFSVYDKEYGASFFSKLNAFFKRITCNHKKYSNGLWTMVFNMINIPFTNDNNEFIITYKHYQNKNYNDSSSIIKQFLSDKYVYNYFITNIYVNDNLVGKIGWITYNKKPMTDLLEKIINNYSKIVAIEDFPNE